MSSIDQVLAEFRDAWSAGRRPDLLDYVEQVPDSDRDELADAIHMWLQTAPNPDYDDATRADIASDPILQASLAAGHDAAAPWATRLQRARERAGLAVDQLAGRLTAAVGLPGEEARTAAYLEQAERDELDERGVSRRLVDGLAKALGVDRDALRPSWGMPAVAAQNYRIEDDADRAALDEGFDLVARIATAKPAGPLDELDQLFRGGPDG